MLNRLELEQIRNSRLYDDTLSLGPTAESGVSIEDDLNCVLSQLRHVMGSGLLNLNSFNANISIPSGKFWNFNTDLMQVGFDQVLIRNKGRRETLIVPSIVVANTPVTIPNGATYILGDLKFRNLLVYRNGILQNPTVNYNEFTTTQIKFTRNLFTNETIQFIINA